MPTTQIRYITGDVTTPAVNGPAVIAHICNDIGAWGRGFVRAVSARWPEPERAYRHWHRNRETNDFGLGAVQLVGVAPDLFVANMIGQHRIRSTSNPAPIRYDALGHCLAVLADHALNLQASVHAPRIGSGLAGGDWPRIADLITTHLCNQRIPVTIYDLG